MSLYTSWGVFIQSKPLLARAPLKKKFISSLAKKNNQAARATLGTSYSISSLAMYWYFFVMN